MSQVSDNYDHIQCIESSGLQSRVGDFNLVENILSTWNMPILSVDEINSLFPSLQSVFYAGGSTAYFVDSFKTLGVTVYSYPELNAVPVAEFIIGALIFGNKGYMRAVRYYRPQYWFFGYRKARKFWTKSNGNFRKVIGIIGCGNVGLALVDRLICLEVSILIHDPYMDKSLVKHTSVSFVSLKQLFSESDVISNHLPDVESTRGILNKNLFVLMKSQVVFINTGRENQINRKDFVRAMKTRPNATAFIDVTKKEPAFPWDAYFWMRNIHLSPHIAGSSSNEMERIIIRMLEDLESATGNVIKNE